MPWQTPDTFTSGQILTAAAMNEISNDLTVLRGDWAISAYTGVDLSKNSTTWIDLGGPSDITLAAAAGDIVEVSMSGLWNNDAVDGFLDVVTMVGSTVTNSFAANGAVSASSEGIQAWRGQSGLLLPFGGNYFYKLVSGDISSGTVTLRLRYRGNAASAKNMYAGANRKIVFFARNIGPVEI